MNSRTKAANSPKFANLIVCAMRERARLRIQKIINLMKYSLYFIHRLGRFGNTFLFCQNPHLWESARARASTQQSRRKCESIEQVYCRILGILILLDFHYIAVPAVMCVSSDNNNSSSGGNSTKTEFYKSEKSNGNIFSSCFGSSLLRMIRSVW